MAIPEELKLKAEALLAMGETPKAVAEKLNMGYQTALSWKKRLDKKNESQGDLQAIIEVEPTTLHTIAESVKETAPPKVAKQIDKLVDGVTGLQKLEPKFHAVVINLLEAAEEMSVHQDLSVKDWATLSTGIGSLYNSIFNKSGVNVNVMNSTTINSEKMSMFKGSMRNV